MLGMSHKAAVLTAYNNMLGRTLHQRTVTA
jgi:hypothetical protein